MSARTLKRFAVGQRLFRRTTFYMILAGARLVQTLTEQQIVSKSQIPTPQWLLQECIRKRIYVSQQIIIILMAVLDPVQVELHLRRRMRRKGRLGPGPDYVWNIGTFCELQQYGISCNVCVDEYSGNVIFANICKANSSDSELLNFYTKVVKMRKGCPVLLKIKSNLNCNEFNRVSGTQVIVARNTPAFCLQLEKFWKYLRSRIKRWPILCSSLQKDGLLATNDLSWQRQIRQIQVTEGNSLKRKYRGTSL